MDAPTPMPSPTAPPSTASSCRFKGTPVWAPRMDSPNSLATYTVQCTGTDAATVPGSASRKCSRREWSSLISSLGGRAVALAASSSRRARSSAFACLTNA